ncbi:MAG: ParB/RepB/Spo0J family partition protein [Patescibacteria group bacterium]
MAKPFKLGKGLGSLIPKKIINQSSVAPRKDFSSPTTEQGELVASLPPEQIKVNPYQPRHQVDHQGLDELVASIKAHGIIQPLVVSPQADGTWQLIAGERRLRAAQQLGLKTVPAIVRGASKQQHLELSLIENIQRQNLNPIEEAISYKRLHDEFNLTQEEIAKQVGKSRPQVANTIRLLELPPAIQQALASGKLTLGHAKVILSLETATEQEKFFKSILRDGLTVKETTWGVKRLKGKNQKSTSTEVAEFKEITDQLRQLLGTKVKIKQQGKTIKVEIEYYSFEELQQLVDKLK